MARTRATGAAVATSGRRSEELTTRARKAGRLAGSVADTDQQERRKRRRLNNALFDLVLDGTEDLEEAAASLVSMLDYESEDGVLQLLNFVVKAAGCTTSIQLVGAANAARDLTEDCKEYAPSTYPLIHRDFQRKLSMLMRSFVPKLYESGNLVPISTVLGYLFKLSEVGLRSLRHAAVFFISEYAVQLAASARHAKLELAGHGRKSSRHRAELEKTTETMSQQANSCIMSLRPRCTDVNPTICEIAICGVAAWNETNLLSTSLNNDAAVVRRMALHGLANLYRSEAQRELRQSEPVSETTWRRVGAIAKSDTDQRCRIGAIELVAAAAAQSQASGIPQETIEGVKMLVFDENHQIRVSAAKLLHELNAKAIGTLNYDYMVTGEEVNDEFTWPQIIALSKLNLTFEAAFSLGEVVKISFQAAARLLLLDSSRPSTKPWITPDLLRGLDPLSVLSLAEGLAASQAKATLSIRSVDELASAQEYFSSALLEQISHLVAKFEYDDILLAKVLRLGRFIDLGAVARRGFDAQYEQLLSKFGELWSEHPNVQVFNSLRTIFDLALDEDESTFAVEARHELNTALNRALSQTASSDETYLQLLYLSRWLRPDEINALPFPSGQDSELARALVRVIGIKGDQDTAQKAVDYLVELLPTSINSVLEVLTAAKMRKFSLLADGVTSDHIRTADNQTARAYEAAEGEVDL